MIAFWLGLGLLFTGPILVGIILVIFHTRVLWIYLPIVVRIFQEKPLFIVPRGIPSPEGEEVTFPALNGQKLRGCYLKGQGPRRGVIVFGLEFGSDRWSCRHYVEHLREAGYDIFSFEPRCQGESDLIPGYEPLHWVTNHEVEDVRAALAYLKARPDANPAGVGFFGISKGAGAGLVAATNDPYLRCFVTDGVFGARTTTVPYMRHFFKVYNSWFPLDVIPDSYLHRILQIAVRRVERLRGCRFSSVEEGVQGLGARPWLMIHGESDSYIKPAATRELFSLARGPAELWMVPDAKHNQALQTAEAEYQRRVLAFFDRHLAELPRENTTGSDSALTSDVGRREVVTTGTDGR